MARRTRTESFRGLVAEARAGIPHLSLTTDIITGFPGETEADFAESLAFVAEMAFSRLHVFGYSVRAGTIAATMPDQIPSPQIKARTRKMIELGEELAHAFHQSFVGTEQNVLWERATGADAHGLRWIGYTDNYIRVIAYGEAELFNSVTPVLLTGVENAGMVGDGGD